MEVMPFLLKFSSLFLVGAMAGWVLEVFWRRFFGEARRWINPGFNSGPWLPLYGFGVILLYAISDLNLKTYAFKFGLSGVWVLVVDILGKAILFLIFTTLIEFITGLFFIKVMNVKLWNYSDRKGNIKGIVCPLYSFLWTLLGLFFYFFVYKILKSRLDFLFNHLELSFFVGLIMGVFILDLVISFDMLSRLKRLGKEVYSKEVQIKEKFILDYEKFKLYSRDRSNLKLKFFKPFRFSSRESLRESFREHIKSRVKK